MHLPPVFLNELRNIMSVYKYWVPSVLLSYNFFRIRMVIVTKPVLKKVSRALSYRPKRWLIYLIKCY